MKKILLSFVAFVFATVCLAQGSLLATLSHEGEISAYYGASALKAALTAAADGDVITLSSGQFTAVDITKAITLRGAGMSISKDSTNTHESTIIQGNFQINLADSLQGRIIMEGLYVNGNVIYAGTLKNAQFLKCRFNGLGYSNGKIKNTSFIHCRFADFCNIAANSDASFINCAMSGIRQDNTTSNIEMANCIVNFESAQYYYPYFCENTYFKNCILVYNTTLSNYALPKSCTAYNCIGLNIYNQNIFYNIAYKNNTNTWLGDNYTSVFKTFKVSGSINSISDSEAFELTDEAKAKYLGVDGTQVGIHGGNLPYNEQPSTPQITKCNVAAKSTADGKLSVEIEVKAAEY
ncbi:MAG: hypothetical protein ACI3X8_07765 [Alloprevotella sp.]